MEEESQVIDCVTEMKHSRQRALTEKKNDPDLEQLGE